MAKQGMKRPETGKHKPQKGSVGPVPEIEGKAKKAHKKARPQAR